jgi:hypothetical protein
MFEKETEDWKDNLQPEDQKIMMELLDVAKRHKCAYCGAEDVKVSQLWCALIEMQKQINELKKQQMIASEPFKAIVEVGNTEKRKAIDRMIREILRPTGEETDEATKRLVDSLMKF